MNILLINTNQYLEPLGPVAPIGLDYLQGVLERDRHTIKLVDLCFEEDARLYELIGNFTPDAVGITLRNVDDQTWFSQDYFIPRVAGLVAGLKENGFTNIILGGSGFTPMADLIFRAIPADFGIIGDGEAALPGLLREIETKTREFATPGVMYRLAENIVVNKRNFSDVNELPENPRTLVDNTRYFKAAGMLNLETKRGCLMQCAFCMEPNIGGGKCRTFAPGRVVREFKRLYELGIRFLHVSDSEFNLPPEHALEVAKALAESRNLLGWSCYYHPVMTPLTPELIKTMRRAGCKEVHLGIDTASPKVMSTLHLRHTQEEIAEVTRLFRESGILVLQMYIVGSPSEGAAELKETLDFIERCNPSSVSFAAGLRIYPGTRLETLAKAEGALPQDESCLTPIFYRPDFMEQELLPILYERAAQNGQWFVPAKEVAAVGAELTAFISEKGLFGPSSYLFNALRKYQAEKGTSNENGQKKIISAH